MYKREDLHADLQVLYLLIMIWMLELIHIVRAFDVGFTFAN